MRVGGLARVQVFPNGRAATFVEATEPTFAMSLVDTPDAAATRLRYTYDSLTAPTQTFELEVKPCTRYYVAAQLDSPTLQSWKPIVRNTEAIGECKRKFKVADAR